VLRNTAHGFRLICTTTEDLEKMTDEGRFHDELFYRVASLPVQLAPLRDRAEDIPLLVKHYAAQATNPLFDAKLVEFTDDALAVMSAYHWPGNLTELAQIEAMRVVSEIIVGLAHLVRIRHLAPVGVKGDEIEIIDRPSVGIGGGVPAPVRHGAKRKRPRIVVGEGLQTRRIHRKRKAAIPHGEGIVQVELPQGHIVPLGQRLPVDERCCRRRARAQNRRRQTRRHED